jgi:hypothetical protein
LIWRQPSKRGLEALHQAKKEEKISPLFRMSGKLTQAPAGFSWANLANENDRARGRGAAAGAAARPATGSATRRRRSAARKIQRAFRGARSRLAHKRRVASRPYRANGFTYNTRRAHNAPRNGNMRWTRRANEGTYEIYDAGAWTRAYDPYGTYGGPYTNARNLAAVPGYAANQAEFAQMHRETQEAAMRARAAAAVGIPEADRQAIAARVGKAAQKQAKDAGASKAEAAVAYREAYDTAFAAMSEPGASLEAALGAAANVEAAAGVEMSAREARRAMKKSGAGGAGP